MAPDRPSFLRVRGMTPRQMPGLLLGIAIGLATAFFLFSGRPERDPGAGSGSGPKIPVPEPGGPGAGEPAPAPGGGTFPGGGGEPRPGPTGGGAPGGGTPGGGSPSGGGGSSTPPTGDWTLPLPLAAHLRDVEDGRATEAQFERDRIDIAQSTQLTHKLEETKHNVNAVFKKTARGLLSKFAEFDEAGLADEVHRSVVAMLAQEGHKVDDPADEPWRLYLERVGNRIARLARRKEITYRFHVVRAPVWNAFATPGGNIYFYTGILEAAENEAQVAGILGHEIGHVDLGHCSDEMRAGSAAANLLGKVTGKAPKNLDALLAKFLRVGGMPFNSANEAESDDYGVKQCLALGYSPYTMASLWRTMAADREGNRANPIEVVYRSHPASIVRYMNIMQVVQEIKARSGSSFPPVLYVGRENLRQKVPFEDRGW